MDITDDDEKYILWGEAAPSLTSGECANVSCSECRKSWFVDDPTNMEYRCKDEATYRFGNKCNKNRRNNEDKNLCMTEDKYCHWSWPADDKEKWNSEEAACRSIPYDYIKGDWKYARNPSKKQNSGLCAYDCSESGGECRWSWPREDSSKKNPKGMHRCYVEHGF